MVSKGLGSNPWPGGRTVNPRNMNVRTNCSGNKSYMHRISILFHNKIEIIKLGSRLETVKRLLLYIQIIEKLIIWSNEFQVFF